MEVVGQNIQYSGQHFKSKPPYYIRMVTNLMVTIFSQARK